MVQKFRETLSGKPRQWFNSLDPLPATWEGDKGLKVRFNTKWALKGKTQDALYAEWQHLAFYPAKDDIEDFVTDVQDIATQLGYPDRAQVMAVKGCLPLDVHNSCLNMDTMAELKPFVIRVFDNPRVKKSYGRTDGKTATSAFSMGETVEQPASSEVGKLISKMDSLQLSLYSMKDRRPFKPQVTPRRFTRQSNSGLQRGGSRFRPTNRFQSRPFQDRGRPVFQNQNRFSPRPFRGSRGQSRGRFQSGPRAQSSGRFQNSPNIRRPRVAGKTSDKDKMRCHYCQEVGHFIKECRKRLQDEKRAAKFSLFSVPEETGNNLHELFSDIEKEQPEEVLNI